MQHWNEQITGMAFIRLMFNWSAAEMYNMNPAPVLYMAFKGLNEAMSGSLDGTKIESIKDTIQGYAIASAVASMASGIIPGVAGVVAALTQAGFIWATYVKINKTLGISMTENTAKFIGSAILTNIVTGAGAILLAYAGAAILSFIPLVGQVAAAAINGALGYIIIYASAVIYLQLISRMILPDGSLKITESDETKQVIKGIISENNLEDIIKEGRNSYKQAKADGSIEKAKNNPKCPGCGAAVSSGQKFCSECGTALK